MIKERLLIQKLKPIIYKMKIPILVFCLTVIFGNISCRIYSNENADLIEGTAGDENYDVNYFDVPLEKSLSRYERASTLSPVTDLIDMIETDSTGLFQLILNVIKFINGLLTEQKDLCSMGNLSVEKLIVKLIEEITHPIEAIKIIICYIYNAIGEETRTIGFALSKTVKKFLCTIFLPGLHTILGEINNTFPNLPANIKTLISTFNTFYPIIKLIIPCNN